MPDIDIPEYCKNCIHLQVCCMRDTVYKAEEAVKGSRVYTSTDWSYAPITINCEFKKEEE